MTSSRAAASRVRALDDRKAESAARLASDSIASLRSDLNAISAAITALQSDMTTALANQSTMDGKLDTIITNTTP